MTKRKPPKGQRRKTVLESITANDIIAIRSLPLAGIAEIGKHEHTLTKGQVDFFRNGNGNAANQVDRGTASDQAP